LDLWISADLL
jgi:hypothetical protein